MARLKNVKRTSSTTRPKTSILTAPERIKLIANLIIDRIIEDQRHEKVLFKRISKGA